MSAFSRFESRDFTGLQRRHWIGVHEHTDFSTSVAQARDKKCMLATPTGGWRYSPLSLARMWPCCR